MLVAVDIDGTLGYRNEHDTISACNRLLRLEIAGERLAGLSMEAFTELPEVLAYKGRVGEEHYARAVGWAYYDAEVLRAMHPISGACEGVRRLGEIGDIAYYTARYTSYSEERSQEMARATLQWLAAHDFPNPENVVFCDGILDKLKRLAQHIEQKLEPVVLVDDQYVCLLERLALLDEGPANVLRQYLTLVGYRGKSKPAQAPVSVIPFSSWKYVEDVVVALSCLTKVVSLVQGGMRT